ncbi:hypothetical protein EI555_019830 [Monodon monoceros]|uniref:Uncharacterized protein n=1 Tax=Monodon monoceros TaxID=40151 RepID=A0A4V5PAF5_MONMO|nr:hypothetical protein EI555_019830 [Monodon monoceros]
MMEKFCGPDGFTRNKFAIKNNTVTRSQGLTVLKTKFGPLSSSTFSYHGKNGNDDSPEVAVAVQALVVPPFGVRRRRGSMFYAEDGDMAHELYEETVVTKNGQKQAKRRRVRENLIPQGIGSWIPPRIHVDFPAILYEV